MKIEKTKPKKNISEVPPVTKEMISRLLTCSEEELVELLKSTVVWRFGKCELYHWIDLLDRFDLILEQAAQEADESKKTAKEEHDTNCIFMCPRLEDPQFKDKIVTVLNFTALLIEHSYARHIYNSTEHLCVLLACPDLDVVLAVLNLLYVFSKRSNFISRLGLKKRTQLNSYLEYLGESWGGKQNGFGLAQCCSNAKKSAFPESCTSVYFEYQPAEKPQDLQTPPAQMSAVTESILLHSVDQMEEDLPELMAQLTATRRIPQVNQMQLLSRIRLAKHFSSPAHRRKCVMARLQAISILVYSMGPPEIVDPLIYDGLVEELVEVLEIKGSDIVEIKAAVLRTITAIIHLERDPRLSTIIDATGAATYHGFLPSLVRDCVTSFTSSEKNTAAADKVPGASSAMEGANSEFPLSFATALFSFLYHLATYEASGDALVTSGIMKALLQVLDWKAYEPMNITLVTRAVRVIDLITMLDMSAFHSQGGWNKMLERLEHEVSFCSKEVKIILPSELKPKKKPEPPAASQGTDGGNEEQAVAGNETQSVSAEEVALVCYEETPMDASAEDTDTTLLASDVPQAMDEGGEGTAGVGEDEGCGLVCMPERAALIKSILNFLKKAIPEPTLAENIRTFVDSSLPRSLKHIVSNAEYYGPSIYLPATEVTTAFIFHEPSQLSALQDNGLPGVVLNSIITKPIPVTREVLSSLPNILSAMCLNARGLQEFIAAEPFDHLFGVLISPAYLPAMRKKKGADSTGDTASNLGVAMDELMRHQPTLRVSVITALIRLLERLIEMGHIIPDEEGTQSSKVGGVGGGDKGAGRSPAVAAADARTSSTSDETRRMSVSANPSQEEHLDMGSDHEDAEDIDLEDDESTDGDEDDGKGDGTRDHRASSEALRDGKSSPPLGEYIVNVVHFLDSILSNNSTDDHMREFITQGGLRPLLKILSLPVLSLDFPMSSACQAIAGPCRSILHIAHSEELLTESLTQLCALLSDLGPFLRSPLDASNSVLLQEVGPLSNVSQAIKSPTRTPILHKLVAVNAFIQLFVNLSRSCQASYDAESRLLCINHWSSDLGKSVLQQISELYRALVWEGFILLAVAAEEDRSVQPSSAADNNIQSDSQTKEAKSDTEGNGATSGLMEVEVVRTPTTPSSGAVIPLPLPTASALAPPMETGGSAPEGVDTSQSTPTAPPPPPPAGIQTQIQPSILVESLKHLTPLLTITSRVGRSLAELMSLLVRLSTSPMHRTHRRGAGHAIIMQGNFVTSKEAMDVCLEITNLLADSLCWEVPMPHACSSAMESPIRDWLFAGMTFKMYAVDFCELLLYDEQKQAYHMMLSTFQKKDALKAFIHTFHMALRSINKPSDSASVYGSCVDFLEAWLNLAEKLVNAAVILDSSHALPVPPPSHANGKKLLFNPLFNPLAFIIQAQKAVFPCLTELWQSPQLSNLNHKIIELLIATVRHFYSNEKLIEAKVAEFFKLEGGSGKAAASSSKPSKGGGGGGGGEGSEGGGGGSAPGTSDANQSEASGSAATTSANQTSSSASVDPSPSEHPGVDPVALQQLMDMGFSQDSCAEALVACGNSFTHAMDWILNQQQRSLQSTGEAELSEEEQIMRAIALSLGQDIDAPPQDSKEQEAAKKKEEEEEKAKEEEEEREKVRRSMEPLDKVLLDDFSDLLLPGCLRLAATVSESVYRVCDLISALAKRNGGNWRAKALESVSEAVQVSVSQLSSHLQGNELSSVEDSQRDSVSCHLLLITLLMEEMPVSSAKVLCQNKLLSALVDLLHITQTKLTSHLSSGNTATMTTSTGSGPSSTPPDGATPKWLAPLLLLLDMWEKTLVLATWTRPPKKDCTVVWQWFDNTRWCSYSQDTCAAIEKAYQGGETSISVRSVRQRMDSSNRSIIYFGQMVQCTNDSTSNRPVLRLEIPKSEHTSSIQDPITPPVFQGLVGEEAVTTMKCCTKLISGSLDPDTLHSNLRMCLRLTRTSELAVVFTKEGGPAALLALTRKSCFRGIASLITLIFKHCLELGPVLRHAMEIVVRAAVTNPYFSSKDIRPQTMGSRELNYVLRKLGPCAVRHPRLFLDIVHNNIQLCSALPPSSVYTSTQRIHPTLVKCVSSPSSKLNPNTLVPLHYELVQLLVNQLCAESSDGESSQGKAGLEIKSPEGKAEEEGDIPRVIRCGGNRRDGSRHNSYRRQLTAGTYEDDDDLQSEDMIGDSEEIGAPRLAGSLVANAGTSSSPTDERDTESGKGDSWHEQPLLSKAAILRLLSELVETYPFCAQVISEASRTVKVEGQPAREMSVLSFVFDYLLPTSYSSSAKVPPVAKLSKTLIQSLAVSHPSPETIAILVTEFKQALSRALSLPESTNKHNRVRALTGLLSQISENFMAVRGSLNPSHFVRLLIRKGFISDLARAIHSLNLSSSLFHGTANSILKPLEVLTKMVNQVAASGKKGDGGSSGDKGTTGGETSGAGTSQPPLPEGGPRAIIREYIQQRNNERRSSEQQDTPTTAGGECGSASVSGEPANTEQGEGPQPQQGVDESAVEPSLLEATHESLIPLEEEEEEGADTHADLVDHVMHLPYHLGHPTEDAIAAEMEDMMEELSERMETGEIPVLPSAADITFDHPSGEEDGTDDGMDSEEDDEDDDDMMEDDRYNSAGEEVEEEDDYDNSHSEDVRLEEEEDDDGSELTDAPSSTQEDGEEPESSSTEMEDSDDEEASAQDNSGSVEPGTESEGLYLGPSGASNTAGGTDVTEETGTSDRTETAGPTTTEDREEEDDEDGVEEDEEEEEEDELDLEYSYDDEDEDDRADDLHMDIPPWNLRDELDFGLPGESGGFPSFFSRAYHSRLSQLPTAESDHHVSVGRNLPQVHPLLVRHADHPQQVASRAIGSGSSHPPEHISQSHARGGAIPQASGRGEGVTSTDAHQHESVMQQLLSNISAAAGTNDVLGFGVGTGTATQRNRESQSVTAQPSDSGLESSQIPTAYARWQEESNALDGHAPHLCIAALRDLIVHRLSEAHKKEKGSKTSGSSKAKTSSQGSLSAVPPAPPVSTAATSQGTETETCTSTTAPVTPHPSDQPTPSNRSPRDTVTSSVEQLRSSLRQVADALAQTVAAVRTTQEQLRDVGGDDREGSSSAMEVSGENSGDGDPEVHMRGQWVELPDGQYPTPPTTTTTTASSGERTEDQDLSAWHALVAAAASGEGRGDTTVSTSSTLSAAFPTFDGSQESAAATLANTDPNDPLHTFLSAIVRAPPPPLTVSNTTTSSTPSISTAAAPTSAALAGISTATTATITSAFPLSSTPRFMTITQYLQRHPEETAAFLAGRRPLPSIPQTSSAAMRDVRETDTSQASTTTAEAQASSIADELFRALVPSHPSPIPATTLASSLGSTSTTPLTSAIPATSTATQAVTNNMNSSTTHSPSPSDTLAPLLMSTLQMPASSASATPGSSGGVSVMDITGAVGPTIVSPSPLGSFPSTSTTEVRTPQEQASPMLGDDVAMLSNSLRHLQQHWQQSQATGELQARHLSELWLQSHATGELQAIPLATLETFLPLPVTSTQQSDPFSFNLPPLVSSSQPSTGINAPSETTTAASSSELPTTSSPSSSGLTSTPLTPSSLVSSVPTTTILSSSLSPSTTAAAVLTATSTTTAATATTTEVASVSTTSSTAATTVAVTPATGSGAQAQAQPTLTPIDPAFLEALPDSIRQEVVAQHEREQRLLRARQETSFSSSISPEFLAALPPNIQEEVLQQERLEYNRQHRDQAATAAATDPMDNEAFFLNLPPDLRRNILADMDDSLISHLPERMRSEAQALRQERDSRRRQILEQRHAMLERMMEEAHLRLSNGGGGGGESTRRNAIGRRDADLFIPGSWPATVSTQGLRYAVVNVNPHVLEVPTLGGLPPGMFNFTGRVSGGSGSLSIHHSKLADQNSKQMLDQEALACLLVLLFLDQNKIHNNRLHRIIRNLSQHSPTRAWILSSLLAIIKIMKKTPSSILGSSGSTTLSSTCPMPPSLVPRSDEASSGAGSSVNLEVRQVTPSSSLSSSSVGVVSSTPLVVSSQPQCAPTHWLDMSINAALGSHAKIFQFVGDSSPGKGSAKSGSSSSVLVGEDINSKVSIHPLAATTICHNVLDLLVFLGRHFGSSFLPSDLLPRAVTGGGDKGGATAGEGDDDQKKREDISSGDVIVTNFWQILLKLDCASGRKGKGSLKGFKYSGTKDVLTNQSLFSNSILGQLMALLSHEIIKSNPSLVDKLLRTLSIASNSIPRGGLKSISTKSQDLQSSTQEPSVSGSSGLEVPSPSGTGGSVGRTTTKESYSSEASMVAPPLLQNVVSVLISGRCSEEGLEEATTLLTNLSKSSISTRESILFMLLDGVRTIGRTLCSQIAVLLEGVNAVLQEQAMEGGGFVTFEFPDGQPKNGKKKGGKSLLAPGSNASSNNLTGIVLPTSGPDDQQQHVDHSHDLHIPSMEPLTCKGSQQSFFVRMLKVVCQLRESAQQALLASKSTSSVTAALETSSDPNTSAPSTSAPATAELSSSQQQEEGSERMAVDTPSNTGTSSREERGSTEPSGQAASGSGSMQSQGEASSSQRQQDLHKPEVVLSLLGDTEGDSKPSFLKQTLSLQLELEELWSVLSDCLDALSHTEDPHAVFVLQPTVEAFFLVHANYKEESSEGKKRAQDALRTRLSRISSLHGSSDVDGIPSSPSPFSPLPGTPGPGDDFDPFAHLPPDTAKFLKFAEKHRTVLNQILRQSTIPLADGPFAVLVNYTKHLDFDIKRRHFRHELERMDEGLRREDIVLHLRRDRVFEDSFREFRRPAEDLKGNLYIQFEGEEGQDVGGLLREWYLIIAREMFNPNYALFQRTPGDHVTYIPNPNSNINPNHLDYFKFIGRVIAKAIFDNKLLDCYFTRSFYKHILGKQVHYTDMEAEDYTFYQSMVYLLEHDLNESGLDFTFSVEMEEFGHTVTKDLIPNGRNVSVTEANKREYVQRACNMKMKESIKSQIDSFLKGFYDIIPKDLISIFNEQELELLISGLPTIDIDDLKANTEYHKYTENSLQIIWFWRALRSFDQADRANFLQFVTGTSKVPLTGFASLEGMNGVQKFQIHRDDRSTDRLPCAHTCFNQLDLPPYETYDKLRHMLLTACRECPEGFGFA